MSIRLHYKMSEVGEIPEEWEVVELGEIISRLQNGLSYEQSPTRSGIPITRIETISEGNINAQKVGFVEGLGADDIARYKLHVGDILFSHINSVQHIGKTAIYQGEPPLLIHGMNLLLIRPNVERADPLFLLHCMKYEATRNRIRSLSKKAVNQASVNTSELKRFKVSLPRLQEQRKIASVLSRVDDAIQNTDEIIAKTQQLKRGLMQRLLTKGIGHTKLKQTEIGEIPEDWEIKTLREIVFDVKDGASLKPEDFAGSGFPVLHKGDIKRDDVIEVGKTNPFCKEEVVRKSESSIIDDSFLVVTLRERSWDGIDVIGTIAHSDGTYLLTQGAYAFHCNKEKVDPRFLVYLSNSSLYRRCMRSITIGSAQIHIRMRELLDAKLPIPPLNEQHTIASILFSAHEKIRKEKLYTHSLERLKKGLMQVLLTGKVRVKVN
jgi:type I restriction enzyme S subunit